MPTPARRQRRLDRFRQNVPNQWNESLVEKIGAQLDLPKILKKFARLVTRIDSRQRIARAVSALIQEFSRGNISVRISQ